MNKTIIKALLLLGYCVPYVFLAMQGDITYNTMSFYLFLVLGLSVLLFFVIKYKEYSLLIIGNLLSFITSFTFMQFYYTELWDWYYKPFSASMFIATITAVIASIEYLVIFAYNKTTSKNTIPTVDTLCAEEIADCKENAEESSEGKTKENSKEKPEKKEVKYREFNYRD